MYKHIYLYTYSDMHTVGARPPSLLCIKEIRSRMRNEEAEATSTKVDKIGATT